MSPKFSRNTSQQDDSANKHYRTVNGHATAANPHQNHDTATKSPLTERPRQKESSSTNSNPSDEARRAKYAEHDDQEDLTRLNPSWLELFKEEEQLDHFFRDVLPILTLKVNQDHYVPPSISPGHILKSPKDRGLEAFTSIDFDVKKALQNYESAPMQYLGRLQRFVVIERARIMFDKLWERCPEFYLLGLAYKQLGEGKLDEAGKNDGAERNDRLLKETLQLISDLGRKLGTGAQKSVGCSTKIELTEDQRRFEGFLGSLTKDIEEFTK